MTKYEKELSALKPHDGINGTSKRKGYDFISTYGHGYLVVPKESYCFQNAIGLCQYGFVGKKAVYLEEDCEMPQFLKLALPHVA